MKRRSSKCHDERGCIMDLTGQESKGKHFSQEMGVRKRDNFFATYVEESRNVEFRTEEETEVSCCDFW